MVAQTKPTNILCIILVVLLVFINTDKGKSLISDVCKSLSKVGKGGKNMKGGGFRDWIEGAALFTFILAFVCVYTVLSQSYDGAWASNFFTFGLRGWNGAWAHAFTDHEMTDDQWMDLGAGNVQCLVVMFYLLFLFPDVIAENNWFGLLLFVWAFFIYPLFGLFLSNIMRAISEQREDIGGLCFGPTFQPHCQNKAGEHIIVKTISDAKKNCDKEELRAKTSTCHKNGEAVQIIPFWGYLAALAMETGQEYASEFQDTLDDATKKQKAAADERLTCGIISDGWERFKAYPDGRTKPAKAIPTDILTKLKKSSNATDLEILMSKNKIFPVDEYQNYKVTQCSASGGEMKLELVLKECEPTEDALKGKNDADKDKLAKGCTGKAGTKDKLKTCKADNKCKMV